MFIMSSVININITEIAGTIHITITSMPVLIVLNIAIFRFVTLRHGR